MRGGCIEYEYSGRDRWIDQGFGGVCKQVDARAIRRHHTAAPGVTRLSGYYRRGYCTNEIEGAITQRRVVEQYSITCFAQREVVAERESGWILTNHRIRGIHVEHRWRGRN